MTARTRSRGKITLLPLVAATYFMVAGGPYGLEELVAHAGFPLSLAILLVTPLVFSLPSALMVAELASALPCEGGYYVWVRRAMGPFAGFMECWLSLLASVFDMAIYPTLFVLYLSQLVPALGAPFAGRALGVALIATCALWNLRGVRAVGQGALGLTLALLLPFAVMSALAPFVSVAPAAPAAAPAAIAGVVPAGAGGVLAGLLVAMWNYMGWDNASTIAGEVEHPQRTYPLAMMAAVALVTLTYVIPVAAIARTGIDPSGWTTGSWAVAAEAVGGRWLAVAVVLSGAVSALGMESALVLSYSRLPLVLAEDGLLPSALARRDPRTGAPVAAIVACAIAYGAALHLGFARLVTLDVMLYGLSLLLEFAALLVLRVREPALARPFRIPGGLAGAFALSLGPTALIVAALIAGRSERAGPLSALSLGLLLVAAGPPLYFLSRRARAERSTT